MGTGGFDEIAWKLSTMFNQPAPYNIWLLTPDYKNMENTQTLDMIAGGLAIAIVIGSSLLMHTTFLTTKNLTTKKKK